MKLVETHSEAASHFHASPRRVAGLHRGSIWMSDDFNDPIEKINPQFFVVESLKRSLEENEDIWRELATK